MTVTIVAETLNCDIFLNENGFYARCRTCPWVSEGGQFRGTYHAKFQAVAEAKRHDGSE